MPRRSLVVESFAHVGRVEVPIADLTVLVGPQATGKSLVLQLLKLAIDGPSILATLNRYGFRWDSDEALVEILYGEGMGHAWHRDTSVRLGQRRVLLPRRPSDADEQLFYVPAHRALTLADGLPRPFQQYSRDTPFVVRQFSETLLAMVNRGDLGPVVFPARGRISPALARRIEDTLFPGSALRLESTGMRERFELIARDAQLPYMTWTAGQREFVPLLLGLYRALPAWKAVRARSLEWIVIEEPEMGLHPQAVEAVLALVILEVLARGYRVLLSTHSTTVIELVWGLQHLRARPDRARAAELLCEALQIEPKPAMKTAAEHALECTSSVTYLHHDTAGRVQSTDITSLDPADPRSEVAQWGGLTSFASRMAEILALPVQQRAAKPGSRRAAKPVERATRARKTRRPAVPRR